jgi:hypothetical protein
MTITIGTAEQIAIAEKIAADANSQANRNIVAAKAMIAGAPADMAEGAARFAAALDRAQAHAAFWLDATKGDITKDDLGCIARVIFHSHGGNIVRGLPCDYDPFK